MIVAAITGREESRSVFHINADCESHFYPHRVILAYHISFRRHFVAPRRNNLCRIFSPTRLSRFRSLFSLLIVLFLLHKNEGMTRTSRIVGRKTIVVKHGIFLVYTCDNSGIINDRLTHARSRLERQIRRLLPRRFLPLLLLTSRRNLGDWLFDGLAP